MIFTTKWRNQSHLILHIIVCRDAKRSNKTENTNNFLLVGQKGNLINDQKSPTSRACYMPFSLMVTYVVYKSLHVSFTNKTQFKMCERECEKVYLEVRNSSYEIIGHYKVSFLRNDDDRPRPTISFTLLISDLVKSGFDACSSTEILASHITTFSNWKNVEAYDWMLFGPLSVRFSWPPCCTAFMKKMSRPENLLKTNRLTLRDVVRAQLGKMENSGEDSGNASDTNSDSDDKTTKIKKWPTIDDLSKIKRKSAHHQGKSKTFKRKTKRRGRV